LSQNGHTETVSALRSTFSLPASMSRLTNPWTRLSHCQALLLLETYSTADAPPIKV
jgi:hypothetical protein